MAEFHIVESAIRQLHGYFNDAVWRIDAEGVANCFAEDGLWKIAGTQARGRTEIRTLFERLLSNAERALMMPGASTLEVGEGVATGRLQFTEYGKLKDGSSALRIGIYYDNFIEQAGQWRFQSRHIGLHYSGPTDLSAAFVECPDYGPPPGMPGPDEPTFTRRKLAESKR